jgi:hypothetical protein
MDIIKLKPIFILLAFLSFPAHSALFDMSEHSGIIKDSTGNFYKINSAGTVSALQSGSNLTLAEKVTFPTSKGNFSADLARTVAVQVPRVGKAVRSLAVASGPVGMTLTAVSLVCELTDICNVDGIFNQFTSVTGTDAIKTHIGWCVSNGGSTPCFQDKDFDAAVRAANACFSAVPSNCQLGQVQERLDGSSNVIGLNYKITFISDGSSTGFMPATFMGSYTPPAPTSSPATIANWDSKESLLNDERFISELLAVNAPVPVGTPSLPAPVSVPIGSNTKTVKDANGNVTGTETTSSEAVLDLPTSGENPTGSPTIIKIVENHTTNNYNTNNELTGSTTTTSGGTEQQQPESQSVEIEIDNIEATPLQERAVPFPFETDTWGSGSCPSDRSVNYHYGTLNLTFEPACQFAEGIKPIVLILAGFIAMFIIMGGTKDAN